MGIQVLVHHYKEHVLSDPGITFSEFLAIHYADVITHQDDEHHDHERLPFKSNISSSFSQVLFFNPVVSENTILPFFEEIAVLNVHNEINYQSEILTSCWQPPCFC